VTSIKVAFKLLPRKKIAAELIKNSTCKVICPRSTGDELMNIQIEFTGALLQLPSSNDRVPFRAGRFLTLDWHKEGAARLDAMTQLYTQALVTEGLPPPTFGKNPVHIHIVLGHRKGRWDCHNTPKAVCDWLEDIGLIDDDSRAQCWASRATWFDLPAEKTVINVSAAYIHRASMRYLLDSIIAPAD
jgi:hypothetical protein